MVFVDSVVATITVVVVVVAVVVGDESRVRIFFGDDVLTKRVKSKLSRTQTFHFGTTDLLNLDLNNNKSVKLLQVDSGRQTRSS